MTELPALTLTGSNRKSYFFSRLLIVGLIAVVLFIVFAPWRQFVTGSGRVIAFNPLDRSVNIEAPIEGRLRKLNVVEGQVIKKGEIIAEIEDNDPDLLKSLKFQSEQLNKRLETEKLRLSAVTSKKALQELAKDQAIRSAREKIAGAEIESETAQLNLTRVANLYEKGFESQRNHEAAILRRKSAVALLEAARADLIQTEKSFDSVIADTIGAIQAAKGGIASAERDLSNLDITLRRTSRQVIEAPRDSIVLAVPVTDGSYLKPGTLICTLIPQTESRFVEIMVDGNDIALIQARDEDVGIPGSPVRLAFEGWPAIQAIGWPQLAIGTFGGEVVFVDATDDGTGKFRVVVGPATDIVNRGDGNGDMEVPWPDHETWLRQGVRTRAWLMLDQVPLWFEIWRQINGFPPIGTGIEEADPTRKTE
ncbi:MAG: adhesin transport system membrane fusion protein [Akkermansiaceae bacterium]|jgi:adhesin transport system membrane fusion protein